MNVFLPREDLVKSVLKDVLKGRSVLLAGCEGVGKSFLMKEAAAELEVRGHDVAFVEAGGAFKQVVLGVAEALHERGELVVDGLDLDGEWGVVSGRVARPAVDKVAPGVIGSLARSDLVVVLDDFDKPWPRYASHYKRMFDSCTVLAASEQAHGARLAQFRPYFRVVDVPRLGEEESRELAEQLYEAHGLNAPDPELVLRKLTFVADGLPLRLRMLFEDAAREGVVTEEFVRGVERDGPKRFVNVGWVFLLIVVGAVVLRYVALGSGDRDMYVTAGILTAVSLVARSFIFRGMR